jgi:hypothetical protein
VERATFCNFRRRSGISRYQIEQVATAENLMRNSRPAERRTRRRRYFTTASRVSNSGESVGTTVT